MKQSDTHRSKEIQQRHGEKIAQIKKPNRQLETLTVNKYVGLPHFTGNVTHISMKAVQCVHRLKEMPIQADEYLGRSEKRRSVPHCW